MSTLIPSQDCSLVNVSHPTSLPGTDDRDEASQYAKDAIRHGLVGDTTFGADIRKKERTTDLVIQAVKSGFRGIDTACQPKHYREDLVETAISTILATTPIKREELFIQTKFTSIDGQDTSQPLPYDPKSSISEQVTASFHRSLQNLQVGYIDSVVLHSPLRTREKTLEAYQTLEGFANQGQVRNLGVSNIYDRSELEWLISQARVPVKVVQNRWYEGNGWDWDVYDLCQAEGIRYQSFWTLTGSPSLLNHPALTALGSKHALTPEQTLYKLCQLWDITPLCGSTDLAHVQEAFAVQGVDGLKKDDPEVQALWAAMRKAGGK